jgi:hypothetical protein
LRAIDAEPAELEHARAALHEHRPALSSGRDVHAVPRRLEHHRVFGLHDSLRRHAPQRRAAHALEHHPPTSARVGDELLQPAPAHAGLAPAARSGAHEAIDSIGELPGAGQRSAQRAAQDRLAGGDRCAAVEHVGGLHERSASVEFAQQDAPRVRPRHRAGVVAAHRKARVRAELHAGGERAGYALLGLARERPAELGTEERAVPIGHPQSVLVVAIAGVVPRDGEASLRRRIHRG